MTKLTTVEATVPVPGVDYSNVKFTVEASDEKEALQYISSVARQIGNNKFADQVGSELGGSVATRKLKFKDTVVDFNEATHEYTKGYISGSQFAEAFTKPFNKTAIATNVATKADLTADDVVELWDGKGDVSKFWGSAVHKALELRFKYDPYAKKLGGKEKIITSVDYINDIVESIWDTIKLKANELPSTELFVADGEDKVCGFIDLLVSNVDTKEVVIVDFKTNQDLEKKISWVKDSPYENLEPTVLSTYKLQLSLYAHILKKAGYKVKECQIIHAVEQPKVYKFKPLSIEEGLEWIRK